MSSPLDLASIKRDLDGFSERITALRSFPEVGNALAELENAEEELRVCAEEIERLALLGGDDIQRRETLRNAFQELPMPAFVLDIDGVIMDANRRGAALMGIGAPYVLGKPLAVLVDLRWRGPFRRELARVLREGGSGYLTSRVSTRNRRSAQLELRLSRLGGGQRVLVTAGAPDMGGHQPARDHHEIMAGAAYVRRLDIMARMTRLLLCARTASRESLLQTAAGLLAEECADWIAIDILDDGALRRAVVTGPDDKDARRVTKALQWLPPARPTRSIIERGESILHIPLDAPGALGSADHLEPVISRLRRGSAAGVPVRADAEVIGAILFFREAEHFAITDIALYEELGTHVGLALPPG